MQYIYIPTKNFIVYSSKVIELENNMIKTISNNMFTCCKKLINLTLFNNSISTIEIDAFYNLKRLQILNLSNHYLQNINNKIFRKLFNIISIYIFNNRLISLDNILFKQTYVLQHLFLSNNNISIFHINTFNSYHRNINHIVLTNNNLDKILVEYFKCVIGIRILDISYNKIVNIEHNSFVKNIKLISLNLSHNLLLIINKNIFVKLSKLKLFDISNNTIKCNCTMHWILKKKLINLVLLKREDLTCDNNQFNVVTKIHSKLFSKKLLICIL